MNVTRKKHRTVQQQREKCQCQTFYWPENLVISLPKEDSKKKLRHQNPKTKIRVEKNHHHCCGRRHRHQCNDF